MITIEIHKAAEIGTRGQVYAACVEGRELCQSRTPFFAAARVLQDEGVDPATPIQMRHQGSREVGLHSTVGEAAKWTVEETDLEPMRFRKYHPHPDAVSRTAPEAASGRLGSSGG